MPGSAPTQTLDLRDIHLPDPVSWWPPAPGWWLLLIGVSLVIGFLIIVWKKHQRKLNAPSAIAMTALGLIEKRYDSDKNTKQLVTDLSELIRRVAISVYPREDCAALTGQNWLDFLDRTARQEKSFDKDGRVLIDAPYRERPIDSVEVENLISLTRGWISAQAEVEL